MRFSTIAVKLDYATRNRIERTAQRLDRTSHWLIEHAIFCYLDAVERDGKAPDITPEQGKAFNVLRRLCRNLVRKEAISRF